MIPLDDVNAKIVNYVNGVVGAYSNFPVKEAEMVVNLLLQAYDNDGIIFTMGSGGSGSTAAHLVQDLAKHTIFDSKNGIALKKRFKTLCLNESVATLTAWANDVGYDEVFSQQLANWVEKDDIVLGVSGSGNSNSILKAFEIAKERGATTIALTGHQGGVIKELSDVCVIVPSDVSYYVEDVHSSLVHIWCDILRSHIQGKL